MTTAESQSRIRGLLRKASLAAEATRLNGSVMWLEIRLWWARRRTLGLLGAIDDAKDELHDACQREADRALQAVKRSTPIRSMGLSKVILNSLERVRIGDLSDLAANIHQLEAIPNIGPARAETIRQAFEAAIEKAALEACRASVIDELTSRFVLFRSSVKATVDDLCRKQKVLNTQADDFYAEIAKYCESLEYRAMTQICRKSLRQEIMNFLEQVRLAREKTAQGAWVMPPEIMSEHTLKSAAYAERREITFRFDVKYLREIKIRNGCNVG